MEVRGIKVSTALIFNRTIKSFKQLKHYSQVIYIKAAIFRKRNSSDIIFSSPLMRFCIRG
jgi:hypothetical protein